MAVVIAVLIAVVGAVGSGRFEGPDATALGTPDPVVTRWERIGTLPDGAEFARVAGDRIAAFGRTDDSMEMWLLSDDGGWVPVDLGVGARLVDVAGDGDVIVVAVVGEGVRLTLIDPVRWMRPWVMLDGDRVVSLRLADGAVETVLDTSDGTKLVTMSDTWASPNPEDWTVSPVVEPYPRAPVFLEFFDDGLIVGTEQIGDESPPGRVIVSTDDGATWTEFDVGGVVDFGSVAGVPVIVPADGGSVVYRVDPGPPIRLVPIDMGDVFENSPWPWAGGLASSGISSSDSFVNLSHLNAQPQIIRLDESAGIEGRPVVRTREGLVVAIDGETDKQALYRWRQLGSPDGSLDCDSETTFTMQGIVMPDTRGAPTPEQELREFLSQWTPRFGGEIAVVREHVGSLVVGGREKVVALASAAPAGGWIVLTTHYCEGYGL